MIGSFRNLLKSVLQFRKLTKVVTNLAVVLVRNAGPRMAITPVIFNKFTLSAGKLRDPSTVFDPRAVHSTLAEFALFSAFTSKKFNDIALRGWRVQVLPPTLWRLLPNWSDLSALSTPNIHTNALWKQTLGNKFRLDLIRPRISLSYVPQVKGTCYRIINHINWYMLPIVFILFP